MALVTIIGAGMAGAACAVALRDAGVEVRVLDRGRAPGGRLASPELHGRRVDLGAGYFTVKHDDFAEQVRRWAHAGVAHPWTDTFSVLEDGDQRRTSGPQRWGTAGGTRSLVRHMLEGIDVTQATEVAELPDGPVVVAMPDPQAATLLDVPDAVGHDPVIAVACGFDDRTWDLPDAAFVNGHPELTFVADDGARRGDGAPVLVAHTTHDRARQHLDDPPGATPHVVTALTELLGTPAPAWTHAHRWGLAKPTGRHDAAFALLELDGRPVGLAGDQWCPDGAPRVESAWRSGTALANDLDSSLSI